MVEITGNVITSNLTDDEFRIAFKIPAFSKRVARRRALTSARVKGMNQPEVTSVETIRSGDIPGQTIFRVDVVGDR